RTLRPAPGREGDGIAQARENLFGGGSETVQFSQLQGMSKQFLLRAPFEPAGDQPKAIEEIVRGVDEGLKEQVLIGVTGSGKTNVMAWAIERLKRPVLVLSPNKTLAAQLWAEF